MKKILTVCVLALAVVGCQTTPGFEMGWKLTVPPTISSTSAMHPLPTAPTTTYAVEQSPNMPVITRHVQPVPVPVPPPIQTSPNGNGKVQMEALPMPRESIKTQPNGCGPSYQE